MENNKVVTAALHGDRQAFSQLVEMNQRALVASAWQLTHNREDAEDLAQEACIEAYRKLPLLKDSAKFRPWLFVILRNKCLDYLRQRRPQEFSLEGHADRLAAPAASYAFMEFAALIEQLPLPYREILVARYVYELSYAEIADVLGSNEQAVRVRCLRAREQLRKLAQQEQEDEAALLNSARALVAGLSTTLLSRVTKEVGSPMYVHALASKGLTAHAPARWTGWQALSHLATWQTAATLTAVLAVAGIGAHFLPHPHGQLPGTPGVMAATGATATQRRPPDAAMLQRLNAVTYTPGTSFSVAASGGAYAIALDGRGNLYIPDTMNNRILQYTTSGQFLARWGTKGRGQGQFNMPKGIAIGADDTVYIADSGNSRIQKFSSAGKYLGQWSEKERGDQQQTALLDYEADYIAVNSKNQLYEAEFRGDSQPVIVRQFTCDGKLLGSWHAAGERLNGIALDAAGNVYLVIVLGAQSISWVKKYSPEGKLLGEWQLAGIMSITLDAADHLYLGLNGRLNGKPAGIRKLTALGDTLVEDLLAKAPIERKSNLDGLVCPGGLAVSADGTLYTLIQHIYFRNEALNSASIQTITPVP